MDYKQAIIVRADLKMGKGKIAAQASHASLATMQKADKKIREEWQQQGMKKVVLKVHGKKELLELFEKAKKTLPTALIKDAGHTQVKPGEPTCIAIGPAEESKIDEFTKELKLL